MTIFDAPTREFCVVRREVTNTPLQALVLWNDEQFVEAARVLAQRTLSESGSREERLTAMYRRCTAQMPSSRELSILGRALGGYLERFRGTPQDAKALLQVGEAPLPEAPDFPQLAAWTMIGNVMLSLDATIVRS